MRYAYVMAAVLALGGCGGADDAGGASNGAGGEVGAGGEAAGGQAAGGEAHEPLCEPCVGEAPPITEYPDGDDVITSRCSLLSDTLANIAASCTNDAYNGPFAEEGPPRSICPEAFDWANAIMTWCKDSAYATPGAPLNDLAEEEWDRRSAFFAIMPCSDMCGQDFETTLSLYYNDLFSPVGSAHSVPCR